MTVLKELKSSEVSFTEKGTYYYADNSYTWTNFLKAFESQIQIKNKFTSRRHESTCDGK